MSLQHCVLQKGGMSPNSLIYVLHQSADSMVEQKHLLHASFLKENIGLCGGQTLVTALGWS